MILLFLFLIFVLNFYLIKPFRQFDIPCNTVIIFCLVVVFMGALDSSALTSVWQNNHHSRARLRLLDVQNDRLQVALEMELAKGWYTYYKNPGDFGIPTEVNDLNNSSFDLYWMKYDTIKTVDFGDVLVSNVYKDLMILLIEFACPIDQINLRIRYAVCNDVCIPLSMVFKFDIPKEFKPDEENKLFLEKIRKLIVAHEKLAGQT